MSLSPVSRASDCVAAEPIQQLEAIHEPRNSCSRFRSSVRVLSIVNRFLKAKSARETNLIALAQGGYQENNTSIRVYYASQQKIREVLLPELCKWKSQLEVWNRNLQKKSKNQFIALFQDRSTIKDSLFIIGRTIQLVNYRFVSAISSSPSKILIAEDLSKNIQAVAWCSLKEKEMEIIGLGTAPNNLLLRHVDKKAPRVSGGGAAIISHLFSSAILHSWNIIDLEALPQASPFYQKMGFQPYGVDRFRLPVKNTFDRALQLKENSLSPKRPIQDAPDQPAKIKENLPPPCKRQKLSEACTE